jgi:H+/gluconate symporter-like permease
MAVEVIASNFSLSTLFFLISIIVLLFLALKGFPLVIAGFAAVIIISFAAPGGWIEGFTGIFIEGVNTIVGMLLLVILSGALLCGVMTATGTALRLGNFFVGLVGSKGVPYALIAYVALLCFIGVGVPTFVFLAIALPICKAANIPKSIPLMCLMGTQAMCLMAWGSPGPGHVMVCEFLGVSIYDGAAVGIPLIAVAMILIILMVRHEYKKSIKNGEGYYREGEIEFAIEQEDRPKEDLPPLWSTLVPIIFLIAFIPVLSVVFAIGPGGAAILGQLVTSALFVILNRKHFRGRIGKVLGDSLYLPAPILLNIFAIAGYGMVVSKTLFYQTMQDRLIELPVSPYILLLAGICLVCAVTADAAAGTVIVITALGAAISDAGAQALGILFITGFAVQTFDSLPHSYIVNLHLNIFSHTVKSGYKYVFRTTIAATVTMAIIALIVVSIVYPPAVV